MKIGLIHIFYCYDEIRHRSPFPFGIAYIASYLLQKGYQVEILDLNSTYLKKPEIIAALKKMHCDIFGISSISAGYSYVKALIDIIKEHIAVPVVVGGSLATHSPEIVLKNTRADICCLGPGEHTIYEILENLDNLERVRGIVYKNKAAEAIRNAPAPLSAIDELPWPAYQIMPMEDYIWKHAPMEMDTTSRYRKGVRIMQMITGRGCPMGCRFCSKLIGRHCMLRPIEDIIAEIKFLIKSYKIDGIFFRDELYLVDKQRAYELAGKLKNLDLIWMGQARVDKVDYALIKYMKKCGCISLGFGIESGSRRMLKLMNKGQTVEQIEHALKSCQRLSMDMKIQLILGYPGEDRDSIKETIELFKRLGNPGRRFHLVTPLPGSVLYEDVLKKGMIKDEEGYLRALSRKDSGFSKGLPLVNMTEFSDEQLYRLKLESENKMEQNYRLYLYKHPITLLKHLKDKLLYRIDYKKYLFNHRLLIRKIIQKIGLSKKNQEQEINKKKEELLRCKALQYRMDGDC
jgi:radical SAM superfamily enzyme YgiQ (UPF0313 family)